VEKGLLRGRLAGPVNGGKPYQTIAAGEIGKFAALTCPASSSARSWTSRAAN
jgi:hypothetical protein